VKKISNNTSLRATLSIYSIPSVFVRAKPAIYARSTKCPKFSSRNPLKLNEKRFGIKRKKPKYFNKKPRLKSSVSIKSRIRSIRKNKK
jgi:hypothetical protein